MELLWPGFLYLLGLIPILIVTYIWILRRRKPFSVRYSSLSLVRAALPQQSHWRRHIPFALFLLAMSSLIMAVSRPVSTVDGPCFKCDRHPSHRCFEKYVLNGYSPQPP